MQSNQLRQLRKEFRETKAPADRTHTRATPASLIVNSSEDATTMFNTAGMQPLVPYFMGKPHPTGAKRVYNIQGCVRTVDIEEVGDMHHLTYFEMMGNRSLGDYFKKETVTWSREFLTSSAYLGLDASKLCVTVFEGDENSPRDDEAAQLWKGL
jgi:alanyl-tRNA synthetase